MTSTTITDWNARRFAALELVQRANTQQLAVGAFASFGHDDEFCPAITGTNTVISGTSLNDYMAEHEFFDGEAKIETPWPCGTCVHVTVNAPSVGFENARRNYDGASATPVAPTERDPQTDEAIAYAKAYTGSFEFMVEMQRKAAKVTWTPTPKMVQAILRCKARDTKPAVAGEATPAADVRSNRFAGTCPRCSNTVAEGAGRIEKIDGRWVTFHLDGSCPDRVETSAQPTATDLPEVPAGHYAVDGEDGTLKFYRVDRPTEGRWAGYTFVKVQASDDLYPVKGGAATAILAKIAEAPVEAMTRYGQEIGSCGRCNRTLTDETSRAFGIGPDCRKIMGL